MPGPILILNLCHLIFQSLLDDDYTPIFPLREGKQFVQGHTESKWQSLPEPRCLNSKARKRLSLTLPNPQGYFLYFITEETGG